MRHLVHRIARLEARTEAEAQQGRQYVLWLRPDGEPESLPELGEQDTVICLPSKCRTAEEWAEQVRTWFPQFFAEGARG